MRRPSLLVVSLVATACLHLARPPRWMERHGVEVARVAAATPQPGGLSFSPAADRLAFVDHGLHLVDLATGRRLTVADTGWARVAAWNGEAVVVAGPGPRIVRIGADGRRQVLLDAPGDLLPDRLFVHRGALLLVGHEVHRYTFGREVVWSVVRLPTVGGAAEPLFTASAVYLPGQLPAGGAPHRDPLSASAALSGDGRLALVLRHLPPAAPAYAEVVAGPVADDGYHPTRVARWRAPACGTAWSPDGRIAATLAGELHLSAAADDGASRPVAACAPPAWSPAGDRLFVGGSLLDPGGETAVELFPPDPDTTATWSPDGRLLAVARPDGVWLVRLPTSPPVADVEARRQLIERLHRDGVIDDATLRERLRRLPPAPTPPSP